MAKYIPLFILSLVFLVLTNVAGAQENWSPEHVFYGKGGILTYTPDEQGNIIPDYSNVGYCYGDLPIPDIATIVEVSPVEGDDGATIQAAINSLISITPDASGFRGAVLLKAGIYQVAGQIKISASGIVLRGEGDSEEGTVIIAEGTGLRELIKVDNGTSRTVYTNTKVTITEDYVPVGRKYVLVSNTSYYSIGNPIVLYRPGTTQWISDLKMNQIAPIEGTVQWVPSSYSFYFERLVTRVSGDTIFFRNPVVMAIDKKYGGGSVYRFTHDRLQNIGIENMRLKSAFKSAEDEEHSWNAILFNSAEHSWVRNVTSYYFAYSTVNLTSKSRLITIENCHNRDAKSIITGGRRYSFNLDGSLCLVKNCTSTEGRHDFVNGAKVTGPNVFTSNSASKTLSDIGPHHRWAMGCLYDNIVSDGQINVQDRGNYGTGHGWAGANIVFWNCNGASSICQNPWVSAKNYNFGFIGTKSKGRFPDRPDGVWAGHNLPGIFPVSLYEAQLDERLNGTTMFSAVPFLTQINDSTFTMEFSLPLDAAQIKKENFQITAAIEIANDDFTLTQTDEYTLVFTSSLFNNLPDLSKLQIKAGSLTSKDGKSIEGLTTASFTMEKRSPEITGISKSTDNVTGFGEAKSSKIGYIYLVKYGVNATTKTQLDSLVALNLGRKVEVTTVDSFFSISTKGFPWGYYQYYALANDNRISTPSSAWIIVDAKGPVTGVETNAPKKKFTAYQQNQEIIVNPENEKPYSLDVFSITGQFLYRGKKLAGTHAIDLAGNKGVLIIRKTSESNIAAIKLIVY